MSAARGNLSLLPDSGEIAEDAPQSYAEALNALDAKQRDLENATGRANRLAEENQHLTTALGKAHGQLQRVKAQLNKDLRLHKDYATVERLWGKYRESHPRCREDVPDDWLKLGLDRLRDYDEAALSRALDGARVNPPRSDDGRTVYDKWDNVFRTTGHVLRYIERADQAENRVQRAEAQDRDPELRQLLNELGVSRIGDLRARCDECGRLMIAHDPRACEAPCDTDWQADDWWRRKTEQLERRPAKCDACREPVTAEQWAAYLVSWVDHAEGGKVYVHHHCLGAGR